MENNLKGMIDLEHISQGENIILDASNIEKISREDMQFIVHLTKMCPSMKLTHVNSNLYEDLNTAGLAHLIEVEREYREISVEGCEAICESFNGRIYRVNSDTIIKVYKDSDALEEIHHERKVSRFATIQGLPAAISCEIARVNDRYASVYEKVNGESIVSIMTNHPEKMDWCVEKNIELLRRIHGMSIPAGKLPSFKERVLDCVKRIKGLLPKDTAEKYERMIMEIPESNHMIHGYLHAANILVSGEEAVVVGMDTASVGDPIFELARLYCAYVVRYEYYADKYNSILGLDATLAKEYWNKIIKRYIGINNEEIISLVEDRIRCISYGHLIYWMACRSDPKERKEEVMQHWIDRLAKQVERMKNLVVSWDICSSGFFEELEVMSSKEDLPVVEDFVYEKLQAMGCTTIEIKPVVLAVKDIFTYIVDFTYGNDVGKVIVKASLEDNSIAKISLIDFGFPFKPPSKDENERPGIIFTKKRIDKVTYRRVDGLNILTIRNKL